MIHIFLLLGDFNIDFYNPHTPPYSKLNDTMHTLWLSQAVQEAMHMTSNGGANLLDLAFVSQTSQLNQCEVIPPIGNSDHCGPIIDWKWKPSYSHPRSRLNRRQIWRYAYADFDKANEMLSNTAQIGIS